MENAFSCSPFSPVSLFAGVSEELEELNSQFSVFGNISQGAAFGFSTIAAQAGAQLAPHLSRIVPRLYRYMFDPNPKVQNAMKSIWNSVVQETKATVDKYMAEIMDDLLQNLENNQWRVRESCCLAVNDLIRGRQLDNVLDKLPAVWHILFRIMDDIKESTRLAAQTASKTMSRISIKMCDVNYGKSGEKAISVILPVLLEEGLQSSVQDVRALSLETIVSMSKNAGSFLKPHISSLVPVMLESLTGLEPQYLNYVALRVSGSEDAQQRLDKARVAASKSSPMMDSINLCLRQADETVLPTLIPRLVDLIKSSIGLGTKAGLASVISTLCMQCSNEMLLPYAGKLMAALLNQLADRNATVRHCYASTIAYVCKSAKSSSVDKLMDKLNAWYMEKEDETLHESCCLILKSMSQTCPDTLNEHKSKVLPLVFLAMHKHIHKDSSANEKALETKWKEVWSEVTIGTETAVRLYMEELIDVTNAALQSSSWLMKAQAASAMKTIAESTEEDNMDPKHLKNIITALLSGLSGRTWNGKEFLLCALSKVVIKSSKTLRHEDSPVNKEEIINMALREARKESMHYKIPAVTCLGEILEALHVDRYGDVFTMLHDFLSEEEKEKDADVSERMSLEFKEISYKTLGLSWPHTFDNPPDTDDHFRNTVTLFTSRLYLVTWKEQLNILKSFKTVLARVNISLLSGTSVALLEAITSYWKKLLEESKYSAIREAVCELLLQLINFLQGSQYFTTIIEPQNFMIRDTLLSCKDSHLPVQKLTEEIKSKLDNN